MDINRDELIKSTALSAHSKLCEGYRSRGKTYIKETKDDKWVSSHGTNQVDLCSTSLDELPNDWRKERDIGAEIAVNAVIDAERVGRLLDSYFVEEVAELLHRRWLERSSDRASKIQKFDYSSLTEVEKEKDRHFIRSAIEAFKSVNN